MTTIRNIAVATDFSSGSNAARCPVLVVRMKESGPGDQVLCAVDPALERAVWMNAVTTEEARVQRESMHDFAVRQLEQLARDLTDKAEHPVAVQVLDDVPSRAIVERAAALPADCVAVGHHGQDGGAERVLGSMAQHVLQHTPRDVLVVP